MSDFLQHGLISTLQRLTDGQTSRIAAELEGFAAATPVTLVLPCHAADVGRPALNRLASSVARFGVIDDVIVALNGADAAAFETARQYFKRLPQRYRIVWTDGPRVCDVWRSCGATAGAVLGKGLNVWSACALISHERRSKVAVTLDCDITSCTEEMFARLLYAVLHPQFGYVFAKVYYSRVADRIYGRVTRLLVAPLLQALVRVAGHAPLLDFLQSFRYALAGECAFRSEVAERMQMDAGWGLEIGMLCEVFRQVNPRSVCQVDGGGDYEHKHQPLGGSGGGLERMAFELCRAVFDGPFADQRPPL
jgi:glucosyl-3-phosphoglycerate synthase